MQSLSWWRTHRSAKMDASERDSGKWTPCCVSFRPLPNSSVISRPKKLKLEKDKFKRKGRGGCHSKDESQGVQHFLHDWALSREFRVRWRGSRARPARTGLRWSPGPMNSFFTGRLVDPTQTTDCGYESGDRLCISVDSWWADMNYFLCALPFLAAVDAGIMGISSDQVLLVPPPKDQTKFCLSASSCRLSYPSSMRKWNALYQHLQSPSSSFEDLLKYMWEAHVSTLNDGYKIFEDRFEYYSKPEAGFGKDWSVFVDYIAAANFPTIFSTVSAFQKALPPRVLVDGDRAPFISDFTDLQNVVLLGLNLVGEVDRATGSLSLTLWKILMKTQAAKTLLLKFLEAVFAIINPTFLG